MHLTLFNTQWNLFFADFKYANSSIRNMLFHKYCTAFYGSQILPMFNNCMEELYTALRVAIRKVWRVPWITHCNMLLHIAGCMGIELWCAARCIKYIKMARESKKVNVVIKTIANMGINGSYSIMGGNKRHLDLKFGI